MSHPERDARIAGLFDGIAARYDLLNRVLSLGLDRVWRRRLVKAAGQGPVFVDLAAGTLDVSLALAQTNLRTRVLAMDVAGAMLRQGLKKIPPSHHSNIRAVLADARVLPLPDACADAATIAFGIRNIQPRAQAWAEILRILKPGGRLCVLEFGTGRRRIWGGIYNLYLRYILPRIGAVVSRDPTAYRYLAETIAAFPDESLLAGEILESGFADVTYTPMTSGIVFLHTALKAPATETVPFSAGNGP
ncbi:MAG: ubiquinone/menaquinone biosynthesis methyltransferase [Deltaproteobacteria bacterium]|nr:ubiquinone/menaquinone biosynthesis methyltransferase [Deltaproteobacteria bacterium]